MNTNKIGFYTNGKVEVDCQICRSTIDPEKRATCIDATAIGAVIFLRLQKGIEVPHRAIQLFADLARRLGCEPATSRIFPIDHENK